MLIKNMLNFSYSDKDSSNGKFEDPGALVNLGEKNWRTCKVFQSSLN